MEASAKDRAPQAHRDYRGSLETVGGALLIVAALGIAWTVYQIVRDHVLHVNLLCFVYLIAGALLVGGSLRTARVVALWAAFSLGGVAAFALTGPFYVPWGLAWLYLKLQPYASARVALQAVTALALIIWAYRRLTAPEVLAAMREPRPGWPRFRRRLVLAATLGAAMSLATWPAAAWLQTGIAAERAKVEARAQVGPGYRFYVTRVAGSPLRDPPDGNADVTAYRDSEIRRLHVTWHQKRGRAGLPGLPVASRYGTPGLFRGGRG